MGVEWVFRKAFYDARAFAEGRTPSGADTPPRAALPILNDILSGAVPLRIQARTQKDILSAVRLTDEFGLKFTLEEGTEAYLCLPELKKAGVPVIYGPIYMSAEGFRARTGETDEPRLNAPRRLLDAGIPLALSAQEFRDEEGLGRQAMFAARYGLSTEEALRSITATPARLLGLDAEFGTLSTNAPADLVIWSGEPLDPASRVEAVMIGGRFVYERRRGDDE
jgi:imidazolonepropionase-like amidohydrolase